MASEWLQRQIARLLEGAEEALARRDWSQVRDKAQDLLALQPGNQDGSALLAAAERSLARPDEGPPSSSPQQSSATPADLPTAATK